MDSRRGIARQVAQYLHLVQSGVVPAQIAALRYLARTSDTTVKTIALTWRRASIEIVGRIEVGDDDPVDRIAEISALTRIANLHKIFELASRVLGFSTNEMDPRRSMNPAAGRIEDHFDDLVTGRHRPMMADSDFRIGRPVFVEMEAAARPDF